MDLFSIALPQQTATMATIELCPGSFLGEGFQLQIGLAEIHVPRMWVEEDNKGHHVSQHKKRALAVSKFYYVPCFSGCLLEPKSECKPKNDHMM